MLMDVSGETSLIDSRARYDARHVTMSLRGEAKPNQGLAMRRYRWWPPRSCDVGIALLVTMAPAQASAQTSAVASAPGLHPITQPTTHSTTQPTSHSTAHTPTLEPPPSLLVGSTPVWRGSSRTPLPPLLGPESPQQARRSATRTIVTHAAAGTGAGLLIGLLLSNVDVSGDDTEIVVTWTAVGLTAGLVGGAIAWLVERRD